MNRGRFSIGFEIKSFCISGQGYIAQINFKFQGRPISITPDGWFDTGEAAEEAAAKQLEDPFSRLNQYIETVLNELSGEKVVRGKVSLSVIQGGLQ